MKVNGNADETKPLIPYSMIKYNKDKQIEDSNIVNTYFLIIIPSAFINYILMLTYNIFSYN
ncbi:hypothetical protein PMEGAS67_46110 [Priestia megaterium]|jgi:hypothetical protein